MEANTIAAVDPALSGAKQAEEFFEVVRLVIQN